MNRGNRETPHYVLSYHITFPVSKTLVCPNPNLGLRMVNDLLTGTPLEKPQVKEIDIINHNKEFFCERLS